MSQLHNGGWWQEREGRGGDRMERYYVTTSWDLQLMQKKIVASEASSRFTERGFVTVQRE